MLVLVFDPQLYRLVGTKTAGERGLQPRPATILVPLEAVVLFFLLFLTCPVWAATLSTVASAPGCVRPICSAMEECNRHLPLHNLFGFVLFFCSRLLG